MTPYAQELSAHRFDKAKDILKQAYLLLEHGEYDGSVNRSYYAIFNAIRSLLALIGVDHRRHSGVISCFDRYFVKTGLFPKSLSTIAHNAFDSRQMSDYQDFQRPTEQQACAQCDDAKTFLEEIEQKREQFLQGNVALPEVL